MITTFYTTWQGGDGLESYVEVAWIHNWLTNLISVWLALFFIQRPLRGKRIVWYCMITSFYSSISFFANAWIGLFCIEGIAYLYVFYRQKLLYIISILFRFLCHATCFLFFEGSFHLGAFFPWIHTPIYLSWIVYGFLFFYFLTHALTLMKQKFRYGCNLYGVKTLHMYGYMDSGNLVTCKGIPVIFLDAAYREEIQGKVSSIEIGSIYGKREMEAQLIYCSLDGGTRMKTYVVFVQGLRIHGGYQLLLNLKLLTMR